MFATSYRKGSWGYIGGEIYKMEDHVRQPFGTDKTILNTFSNPLYQTQRIGIKAYQLDVPDGKYEIIMHFEELVGLEMTTLLPYNLLARYKKPQTEHRAFNIYLDKTKIAHELNLPERFGAARAVTKKAVAMVRNDRYPSGVRSSGRAPNTECPGSKKVRIISRWYGGALHSNSLA